MACLCLTPFALLCSIMAIGKNVRPDVLDQIRERVRVRLARARACVSACRDISHKCVTCVR